MDSCKYLSSAGFLRPQPSDAGLLLRMVLYHASSSVVRPFRACFSLGVGVEITIEYDPASAFTLWHGQRLAGWACLLADGVGRVFLIASSTKQAGGAAAPDPDAPASCKVLCDALRDLCAPCVCRAGHLLLVRLRFGSLLKCSCSASFLRGLQDSVARTGACPLTALPETPPSTLEQHALLVADQRKRLSAPR